MDIFNTIKSELNARPWKEVERLAAESGVPFHTLAKIRRGETKDPGILTCQKVMAVLGIEIKDAA
jgi:transcriptional regulator with XRE-family HTH domain